MAFDPNNGYFYTDYVHNDGAQEQYPGHIVHSQPSGQLNNAFVNPQSSFSNQGNYVQSNAYSHLVPEPAWQQQLVHIPLPTWQRSIPAEHVPNNSEVYVSASEIRTQVPNKTSTTDSAYFTARNETTSLESVAPSGTDRGINYQLLLLDLAEEYFAAARRQNLTQSSGNGVLEENFYYRCIATGLSCLEVVLREWRSEPPVEAAIRLRYAAILFQETENYMEAEETLSHGIALCERHRLLDRKYNMQHLLARVTFVKKPKAALKFLDAAIKDVEAYQHLVWVYALRFLRAFLSLQTNSSQENLVALSQLKIITTLATAHGDHAISAVACAIEATIHLQRSSGSDNIEQVQRALAAARRSQLEPTTQLVPQLAIMAQFSDLACSLQTAETAQAMSKLQDLQSKLDAAASDSTWSDDGRFLVPVSSETAKLFADAGSASGIVRSDSRGTLGVQLHWLSKDKIMMIGYILSAAAVNHRNASDGQKAESYLKEASRLSQTMKSRGEKDSALMNPLALPHQDILGCRVQIQLIFALCSRSSWLAAKKELLLLKENATKIPEKFSDNIFSFIEYLQGVIHQANGELDSALEVYSSPRLSLSISKGSQCPQAQRDLCILATLNSALILGDSKHPAHSRLPELLSSVEQIVLSNPSNNIHSAYNLVRATSLSTSENSSTGSATTSILKTKRYLQSALQVAKLTSNNQLICITLNFMSYSFFQGVVAEQAEKSAKASQSLARKGRDILWTSVADGLLAETLEIQGKVEEARNVQKEGVEMARRLPMAMQREADHIRTNLV